jgi:hypothetical protein
MEKKDYEYNIIGDKIKDEILDFIVKTNKDIAGPDMMIETIVIVSGLIAKLLCMFRDTMLCKEADQDIFFSKSLDEIRRVSKLMIQASVKSTRQDFQAKYKKELN